MENTDHHLEALKDIRNIMERSSRFVSLNGFAGIFVGLFALCGALAAYLYIDAHTSNLPYYHYATTENGALNISFIQFFMLDAFLVLFFSILVSSYLTIRKAKKSGLKVWDNSAKRLFINMMIPLLTGGFLCLILVYQNMAAMVAPAMLIFYGVALINASKYTLEDIRFLGLIEIMLGLFAAIFIAHGLIFWSLGFGVMHIVYGTIMYFKYER